MNKNSIGNMNDSKNNALVRRPRRLRNSHMMRELVAETRLAIEDLVYPLFFVEGEGIKDEIGAMPGVYHFSVDMIEPEIRELEALGIKAVLVFGLPGFKDPIGTSAFIGDGIVQKAVRKIRSLTDKIMIITDVCLCQYTSHGHCGQLDDFGHVLNDETLEILSKVAVSHADAGADMVAPSDMMDGRIGHMRRTLDKNGYTDVSIMAYSAKFASAFYGPFREAADSAPQFGDRKTYQMDYRNGDEAIREIALDIEEGADIVMVKPAISYLDIISRAKAYNYPIAAYSVSGEYSMIKNAGRQGLVDEKRIVVETLTAIKRAGATILITYFSKDVAKWIKEDSLYQG